MSAETALSMYVLLNLSGLTFCRCLEYKFYCCSRVIHAHVAPWPRGGTEDALSSAEQEPGPLSEAGSPASSRPLLAEPPEEKVTTIEPPSSENWAWATPQKKGLAGIAEETSGPSQARMLDQFDTTCSGRPDEVNPIH